MLGQDDLDQAIHDAWYSKGQAAFDRIVNLIMDGCATGGSVTGR